MWFPWQALAAQGTEDKPEERLVEQPQELAAREVLRKGLANHRHLQALALERHPTAEQARHHLVELVLCLDPCFISHPRER